MPKAAGATKHSEKKISRTGGKEDNLKIAVGSAIHLPVGKKVMVLYGMPLKYRLQ